MLESDKIIFFDLLANVATLYEKTLTPNVLGIYWDDLKSFKLENVKAAIENHRRNPVEGKFMPKPAHIIAELQKIFQTKLHSTVEHVRCKFYSQKSFCEQIASPKTNGYCLQHWREITEEGKKSTETALHHIKNIQQILKPWKHDA